MLHQKPKAYTVHFFQRGCCTQPQMLDYEGGKHIAPHTYIGATTYCCTFLPARLLYTPQMLDYEGGKHIAPHTYIGATTYTVHFFQRGCFAHHRCWITKAGNTKPRIVYSQQPPHSEAVVQQPMVQPVLFFQRGYCTQPQVLDYEGRKHIATHTYIGATPTLYISQ